MERRRFLQVAGLTGLLTAAGGTGLLSACSSAGTDGQATGTDGQAMGTVAPVVYDPDRPYWLQGNFAPVDEEATVTDLTVRGALPGSLTGLFVRNGSNPATGESAHWFLGDGMVHGLRLDAGSASWYRNRWVQTPFVEQGLGGLEAPPGGAANQSNVSALVHAGRLLTSGEVGWPYELSTEDLSTVGAYDFAGGLTTAMTAHPKIDPATGQMHFFGYGFVPPYLTYHVADASGALVHSVEIPVAGPTMMHDFAITETEAVFWELPVVFDLQAAVQMVTGNSGTMPFAWDPSYGARIGIMPLGGTADQVRWVEIDPCYVFHGTNAFRDGDDVVLDVCRLATAFDDGANLNPSTVRRWRVGTGGPSLTFAEETLNEQTMDLPGIDRRSTGRPYRHGWYAVIENDTPLPFEFAGVRHLDHETGETATWEPEPGVRAGEVVFVPEGDAEGEGWLLTYAYDARRDASDLVVLDATDVAAGPVAAVELPVRVPYGFHGVWAPDEA